jgi:hypothetical protein
MRSLLAEQHVLQSTHTTNNFPKQKRLSILVYIWTDDSHGTSTFLPSGNHLGITLTKLYWLLDRKSLLSMSNKLLLYKVILKPIWTYGIQLWGSASTSNIEILERFQSKDLGMITDAPWSVPNVILRQDLQIPSVKEEIRRFSIQYSYRLQTHPNSLVVHLTEPPEHRRLKRHLPTDLITRFQD